MDAGASYSHAPESDMQLLLSWIGTSKQSCSYLNYIISCPCSGSPDLDVTFPVLEFELGTPNLASNFKIKGSGYMNNESGICRSTIRGLVDLGDKNYWLLGTNFYRLYEIAHDQEGNRIGFKSTLSSEVNQSIA